MEYDHDLWPSVAYAEWMDRLGQELDAVFQSSKTTAQALEDATTFGNDLIRTALAKEHR
jgi:hypothetical protein